MNNNVKVINLVKEILTVSLMITIYLKISMKN